METPLSVRLPAVPTRCSPRSGSAEASAAVSVKDVAAKLALRNRVMGCLRWRGYSEYRLGTVRAYRETFMQWKQTSSGAMDESPFGFARSRPNPNPVRRPSSWSLPSESSKWW